MLGKKRIAVIFAAVVLLAGSGSAETVEENWGNFLHYTVIGQLDLAKGYAQALLESEPDPVELLALSQSNQPGYAALLRAKVPDEFLEHLDSLGIPVPRVLQYPRRLAWTR